MSHPTLLNILTDIVSNPERPEEVPDKMHCKLNIEFLNTLPVPLHRSIIMLQSLEVECEALVAKRKDLDPDADSDEIFQIDDRITTIWFHHACLTTVTKTLSGDLMDPGTLPYSPQLIDMMISESVRELNIGELMCEAEAGNAAVCGSGAVPFSSIQ